MASLENEFYQDGLKDDVRTTCVYPGGIRTRKQFIDMMKDLRYAWRVGNMNMFITYIYTFRIPVQFNSPEFVANAIVNAVLINKTEVVPSTLGMRFVAAIYP